MKILYFAWLRERLNLDEEEVSLPPEVVTVHDLILWLRRRSEAAELAMEKPELVRAAIDARIVDHDAVVTEAEVVALFPPMTGG